MTSREIITKLINEHLIDGEEAVILLNDIFQSEIMEAWKALNNKETADLAKKVVDGGTWIPSTWTTTNIPYTPGVTTSTYTTNLPYTSGITSTCAAVGTKPTFAGYAEKSSAESDISATIDSI